MATSFPTPSGDEIDKGFSILNGIAYAVEMVILSEFIYLKAMEIELRMLNSYINKRNKALIAGECTVNIDWILGWWNGWHQTAGIFGLYAHNSFSCYMFACGMAIEWGNILTGEGRMQYQFQMIPNPVGM